MAALVSRDDEDPAARLNGSSPNVESTSESCTAVQPSKAATSGTVFISSQGELIGPTTAQISKTSTAASQFSFEKSGRPHSARDPFPSLVQTGTGLVQSLIQTAAKSVVTGTSAVVGTGSLSGRSEYGVAYYPLESNAPLNDDTFFCEENYRYGTGNCSSGIVDGTDNPLIEYSVLPLDADYCGDDIGHDVELSISSPGRNAAYDDSTTRQPTETPEQYAINNSLYRRRQVDRVANVHTAIEEWTQRKSVSSNYPNGPKRIRRTQHVPNTTGTQDEPELTEMLLLSELPLQATGTATGSLKSDTGGSFKRVFSNNVDGTYLCTSGTTAGTDTALSTGRAHLSRCGDDIVHGAPHYEFREEVVHGATVSTTAAGSGGVDRWPQGTGRALAAHRHSPSSNAQNTHIPSITIPNAFAAPSSGAHDMYSTSVITMPPQDILSVGCHGDQKSPSAQHSRSNVYAGNGGGLNNNSSSSRKRHGGRRNNKRSNDSNHDSADELCTLQHSTGELTNGDLPTVEMRKLGGVDRRAAYNARGQYHTPRGVAGGGLRRKEESALHRAPYYKGDGKEGGPAGGAMAHDDEGYEAHGGETALGFLGILRSQPFLASFILVIPVAFTSYWLNWGDVVVFSLNFVAIMPMAWLMGKATEDLSAHMGQITGGLLNAWFGNVVEMLLCIAGLRRGELVVVRSTLIGSILSNLLLVTGCSFLLGGMRHKVQEFSAIGASTNASLMTLSCMCLGLPTIYATILSSATNSELAISRAVSFFLIFVYIQYLVFQLVTHSFLFTEDDDEVADLSVWGAAILLLVCSIVCSFCSDYLVSSIEGVVTKFSLSKEFIGIILLPIVGNAAEHYTSVLVAMRNKMDLSLACAVGSSCQMALFVTPFTVLVGWMLNQPMTLDLHPFELLVLVMSVLIITSILQDGYSHWLEGSMLVSAYCVIAIIYFFEEPQYSEII